MERDRDNIRFNVLRNALYHTARRQFFERLSRMTSFVVVVLGASAMSDVASHFGFATIWLGFAIAVFGAIQLAFDYGGQARDHQQLQRDYYNLLADIEESAQHDEAECGAWYARMLRITSAEPPILRAIDAKAYNDALDAVEGDRRERLYVPWHHKPFGWLLSFDGHTYEKVWERAERLKRKTTTA
ncbi:MAG: hypothetical protein JJ902_22700 [Roseibium sp.]|nr:hypothetical protein [Roseibium sp.]